MKRFIVIAILVCLITSVASITSFMYVSTDSTCEKLVAITSILFQSILSGMITFIGLLFTVLSQEFQRREQLKNGLMPCFIINPIKIAGPKQPISERIPADNEVLCSAANEVRSLQCQLVNSKDNYGLNVSIQFSNARHVYFGNIRERGLDLKLLLDGENESYFWIFFEDVYGAKYKQKIVYKYEKEYNRYRFTSFQAERRKKNEKMY